MNDKNRSSRTGTISAPKVYYPFLDGFRGIAIMMILAHHIRRAFTLDYIFVSNPPILKWIYYKSYQVLGINLTGFFKDIQYLISQLKGILGVEFFLVISGFLITGILLRKEIHAKNIIHFYERRFFRIYPCYFLVVMISIAIYVFSGHEGVVDGLLVAMYHLLFLQNYLPVHPLLAHTWTLVVLEQFYFFSPLVILSVNWFVAPRFNRRNVLIGLSIVLMFMGMWIRGYYYQTGHAFFVWPIESTAPYWTITSNLGPICFGSLLALLEPYWSQWKKSRLLGLFFWFAGMVLFLHLFLYEDWSYFWGGRFKYTLGYISVGFLFFAAYHGVSIFARLKSFQWLGKCSYGIYVWHYLVLEFWKMWIGVIPPTLIIVCSFATCIWVGAVSTNTIERFFMAMREKLVPKL